MWPALLLLTVIAYRLMLAFAGRPDAIGLHNFSPMAAVTLCGALFLPKRWAFALPFGALLASDLLLNAFRYHAPLLSWAMLAPYTAFALIAALGWRLREKAQVWQILGASLLGSFGFYVLCNSGAWLLEAGYAHSLNGLGAGANNRPARLAARLAFPA